MQESLADEGILVHFRRLIVFGAGAAVNLRVQDCSSFFVELVPLLVGHRGDSHDEPAATADYEATAKAGNECRARGVTVSVSDILICAIALARDSSVFSTDPDFNSYAKILPLKLHRPKK